MTSGGYASRGKWTFQNQPWRAHPGNTDIYRVPKSGRASEGCSKGMVKKTERKTRKSQWSGKDNPGRKQTTVRTSAGVRQKEEWRGSTGFGSRRSLMITVQGSGGLETRGKGFKGGMKGKKYIHYNDFIKFGNGKKETNREFSWIEDQTVSFPFFLSFSGWKRTNDVFRWKGIKRLNLLDRKGKWGSKVPKMGERDRTKV